MIGTISPTPGPRNPDDALHVEFKIEALEGAPGEFTDIEFVSIQVPGSDDLYLQPATDADRARFPRQYAAYQAGTKLTGTPLAVLQLSPSVIRGMERRNVHTVEALAAVSDGLGGWPGFHDNKRKAQAYLAAVAGDAPIAKVQAELEARDAKIAALEKMIQELAATKKGAGK